MNDETRELLLAGLRQALQAKVVTIFTNVTMAGEEHRATRFEDGVSGAARFYEQAITIIEKMKI